MQLCKKYVECLNAIVDISNIAMKVSLPRMTYNVNSVWILTVLFIKIIKPVNLQFGVPIYGPPMLPLSAPLIPLSAPMPIMAPALVPRALSSSSSSSEENSTTTTRRPKKKPKKKPLCVIPPIVAPQPLVLVPVPPAMPARQILPRRVPRKKLIPIYSSDTDSTDSSSSEYFKGRRHRKRRRQNIYRRSLRSSESDNELLKPMLSYIADNGDVKFETKISNDDVAQLLGERRKANKRVQTVEVLTKEDETNKPQVIVISKDKERSRNKPGRYKQVLLRGGVTNHVLSDGKKELIFRPPADKKISNLSVSFQIS